MSLKEKIIHESLKLFSLNGFLSTSILDIISAAETSKGGFYNHFYKQGRSVLSGFRRVPQNLA